ncbi:MAG: sensor histidine kinase [Candidatus Methylacidiphilaceae bacterium]
MRGRLIVLLLLLVVATASAGALMVGLFRQSATARAGEAQAEIGRACDAIVDGFRAFTVQPPTTITQASQELLRVQWTAVLRHALQDRPGIEGGIWREGKGALAYAFPTYPGERPKTDVPEAELPRIEAANRLSLAENRQIVRRYSTPSQTLLLTASPLCGPIPGLSAWTMTRVLPFAGRSYRLLMAGLTILFSTVLVAAVLLTRLTLSWSRHVRRIESALQAHDVTDLPILAATGERELDRIVLALNDAGGRLAEARRRADDLGRQVAAAERLAAIGRVSAGVAHEIRNPIAAMRLKAENALSGDSQAKDGALKMILGQIERLDALLRRLLSVTDKERLRPQAVPLEAFLASCLSTIAELAKAKRIALVHHADTTSGCFDPEQVGRAIDNLLRNAIEAAPEETEVSIRAWRAPEGLVFSVHDEGSGPPATIREHLFEPFVTGRAGGTGLGLSIVREVASAHGGSARLRDEGLGTTFELVLPWPRS